jgi:hypothetical protein
MKRQLSLQTTVVIGLFMLLSFIAINSAFAQDAPYSEEYMQQHDGGDRAEYLQEMDHGDPSFYAPPTN